MSVPDRLLFLMKVKQDPSGIRGSFTTCGTRTLPFNPYNLLAVDSTYPRASHQNQRRIARDHPGTADL